MKTPLKIEFGLLDDFIFTNLVGRSEFIEHWNDNQHFVTFYDKDGNLIEIEWRYGGYTITVSQRSFNMPIDLHSKVIDCVNRANESKKETGIQLDVDFSVEFGIRIHAFSV